MLKILLPLLLVINLYAADRSSEVSVFDMMDNAREDKLVNQPQSHPTSQLPTLNSVQISPETNTDISSKLTTPQTLTPDQLKNIIPTNEPDISVPDSQIYERIKAKELLLQSTNMPRSVIVGEIFSIDVTANTQSELELEFNTQVDETNIKWLNSKNLEWVSLGGGKYIAKFYLEAKNINAKSVRISLNLKRNGEYYQHANINVFMPKLKELRSDENYNHIVADSLEVKKFKTTKFDDINNIMVVEIVGKNVDLSAFYIENKTILKQGVDTIVGDFNSQSAYYFAVFKPNKKTLDFNYYNLKKAKFESFSLPVSVEDDDVSTQIGLNPKQSELNTYKDIAIYSLATLFFILALIRRKFSYFFVAAVFITLGIYTYNPFGKAVLKPNVSVSILPTRNSTIFYTSQTKEDIEILGDKEEWYKILFKDGKIGWVNRDDLIKN
ncbi:SH3 domain-containing protein [Campylobacter sp. faydin G-24]|uniref:SH3 domain-containing protein n=1 Tax=Campylobacter anatolicus TaxID=2829105 RepID=A0ABS5HI85_9BACT|nr:SH3 domain-containing protein [Campylobacter anatolicus]MBR8463990.1 SH3 domain-containing protein [Campylobacter anatolicus]MBR8465824.1 SH3 domain-containing protein [Campylobacter anatolicus]